MDRESPSLEYKEKITRSFLKTVSAFANYGTGRIVFGMRDDGTVLGLSDQVDACMRIENMINGCLDPQPRYRLEPNQDGTVELTVYEGLQKPYVSQGKAYRRGDTATVAVDRLEYGRLVLEGSNRSFDQLPSQQQDLTFSILSARLVRQLQIEGLSIDVLKTMELFTSKDGYTNAAALLADRNHLRGTDITRFGASVSEIHDRFTCAGVSILSQMDEAIKWYERFYTFERIEGMERRRIERIPREALREAIANALIHRAWDIEANIAVCLWPDRIEIISPGSLPPGIGVEEYLWGFVSVPRNPVIANVFFRLRYIEKFGTGVARIREAYRNSVAQPAFHVYPESIKVVLPVVGGGAQTAEARSVLDMLSIGVFSRAEIEQQTGLSRDQVIYVLRQLIADGLVVKRGRARATRYTRS